MYSSKYQENLKKMHANDKTWGDRKFIPKKVKELIDKYKPKSILDFGCGKGNLVKTLKKIYPNIEVMGWDPSTHDFDDLPDDIDMIISTDVLEHIEPDLLDSTLEDLSKRCKIMYHLIACYPAVAILPDGRNAHLIVENPEWWKNKILKLNASILHEKITDEMQKRKVGMMHIIEYEVACQTH